jgi:Zn-dependent peptidase ImmA (M78 family)
MSNPKPKTTEAWRIRSARSYAEEIGISEEAAYRKLFPAGAKRPAAAKRKTAKRKTVKAAKATAVRGDGRYEVAGTTRVKAQVAVQKANRIPGVRMYRPTLRISPRMPKLRRA